VEVSQEASDFVSTCRRPEKRSVGVAEYFISGTHLGANSGPHQMTELA